MQRAAYRVGVIAALLLSVCLVFGCSSSSDPLDEMGWRWAVREEPIVMDGEEVRREIDLELAGSASVAVTFESNTDVDIPLYLHDVRFVYQLNSSSHPSVALEIAASDDFDGGWVDPAGGELIVTHPFLNAAGKAVYLEDLTIAGIAVEDFWAEYTVSITAHGSFSEDSTENSVTIKENTWFTIIQPIEDEEEEEPAP